MSRLVPFLFSLFFLLVYFFSIFLFFFCFFGHRFLLDFYVFTLLGVDSSFSIVLDFLSLGFFSCVSFISFIVFLYSIFYMEGTVDNRRFYWLVFLFVVSILLLVFSGNFVVTMVGWDGLGLVSFLLVIFYSNSSSLESGLVTVFSNRVGDVFFLLSFMFFFLRGTLTWDLVSYRAPVFFVFFVFFGSITKRAQVPFSAWLPAAMAAPTPVSSLVHSSTLVTAGVYVLIRFNYIFGFFYFSLSKFFFIFTMLLAGFCAILENDFKKIVAMSTLSQLGIIIFILSVGNWVLSFLHIVIHAFFKSILFLRTGSFMGQIRGTQDSRFYGSFNYSYGSFVYFVVSSLCLAGFPFFLGFYSKDFIISSSSFGEGFLLYFLFLVGCFFTVMYRVRLVYKSYSVMYKYIPFMFSVERKFFFIPVSFLFLKCWFIGRCLYWLFLTSITHFFLFFDLFVGIALFFCGLLSYFFLSFFYNFYFYLSRISFLRWKVSRGTSNLFGKFLFVFYETRWIEQLGGAGTFFFLLKLNKAVVLFYYVRLGSLIFLFPALFYYFV